MKYYQIEIKSFYSDKKVIGRANGVKIPNAEYYFDRIGKGNVITDAPVFDAFFLESFDKQYLWEWKRNDVHGFIGEGSQLHGWLVSNDLKLLLQNFNLPQPHHFYASKLLYKDIKYDYYIFQFTGGDIYLETFDYVNYANSIFYDPVKQEDIIVFDKEDFFSEYDRVYSKNKKNICDRKFISNKKLVLKTLIDFLPIGGIMMSPNLVSEHLKSAIETMGIEGFEFSELDYEVSFTE